MQQARLVLKQPVASRVCIEEWDCNPHAWAADKTNIVAALLITPKSIEIIT